MRGARIKYNDGSTHHYSNAQKALNDTKNKLDLITNEDITLELKYYYAKNEKIIFEITAYKGDWCYGKVGTLEILD